MLVCFLFVMVMIPVVDVHCHVASGYDSWIFGIRFIGLSGIDDGWLVVTILTDSSWSILDWFS